MRTTSKHSQLKKTPAGESGSASCSPLPDPGTVNTDPAGAYYMNYQELIDFCKLDRIEIILKIPIRKGDGYKCGTFAGMKPGIYGGGYSNYKNGKPHSYSSLKRRYIKKPKVCIVYNSFTWGGKQHFDWVDVDNCIFKIKPDHE